MGCKFQRCLGLFWQSLKGWVGYAGSLDTFTVPVHSPNGRHLPAVRAVHGDWLSMAYDLRWEFLTVMWAHDTWHVRSLYLDKPITHPTTQPNGGHVSHPIDSPTATTLGLWSSLEGAQSWARRTHIAKRDGQLLVRRSCNVFSCLGRHIFKKDRIGFCMEMTIICDRVFG